MAETNPLARITPIRGCTTGDASEVNRALRRLQMSASATQFLRQLEDLTFSKAGFHQQWGHDAPGSWCWFDLPTWADELNLTRGAIIHLRTRLVAQHIIWFEPDALVAGRGRMGWNLAFSQWTARSTTRWGGKRERAGRPSQQAISDNLIVNQAVSDNLNSGRLASNDNLIVNQEANDNLNTSELFKLSLAGSFQPSTGAAARDSLRMDTIRRDNEDTDAYASDASDKPKPSRKLTDAQLIAHRAEAAYIAELLTGVEAILGYAIPDQMRGQERTGARRFYHWAKGAHGVPVPAPITEVLACYRLEWSRPFWRGKPALSLQTLVRNYATYSVNPGSRIGYELNVQRQIEREAVPYGSTAHTSPSDARSVTSDRSRTRGLAGVSPDAPTNVAEHERRANTSEYNRFWLEKSARERAESLAAAQERERLAGANSGSAPTPG